MGPTGALGVVLAVAGGFVIWFITSMFMGPVSFFLGCAAGWFIWKHFSDKDKAELEAILNPPEQLFEAPLPVVWGSILDVFRNSYVETGVSGRHTWTVVNEDDARGIIQAKVSFQQMLGAGANAKSVPRNIDVTVFLAGEDAGTKVKSTYTVFSPSGTGLVRDAIVKVQTAMKASVETNKQIEGY